MISRLQGILLTKEAPAVLLDVRGVGYELEVSMHTFAALPELGAQCVLHTHLHVREDLHALFGFLDTKERTLFRHLLKVNGIGAKMALAVLSVFSPNELAQVVMDGSVARLVKVPGIGKKTAERLLIDIRDRIKEWEMPSALNSLQTYEMPIKQEALSALVALGYKENEANRMLAKLDSAAVKNSNDLIRLALQQVAQ